MYLRQTANTNEARSLIDMVQYYRDMFPRRSRILAPLTEAYSVPKVRKMSVEWISRNFLYGNKAYGLC